MNDLKEFAIFYVNEHDRLSKEEKQLFYNFIKEASDDQVTYLLTTGKMKNTLTESDRNLVSEFGIEKGWTGPVFDFGQLPLGAAAVGASVVAALIARSAYRLYKDKLSKIGKQCSHFKHGSKERNECELKAKNKAKEIEIAALKKLSNMCVKSKNPSECKEKIMKKIAKIKR